MPSMAIRFIAAAAVGIGVGVGVMFYDKSKGAEWAVRPDQVGQESRPGTVAVRLIRSETADLLPYKWTLYGVVAGAGVLFATRRRKVA